MEHSPFSPEHIFMPYVDALSSINSIPSEIKDINSSLTRGQMAELIYRIKAGITTIIFTANDDTNGIITDTCALTVIPEPPIIINSGIISKSTKLKLINN